MYYFIYFISIKSSINFASIWTMSSPLDIHIWIASEKIWRQMLITWQLNKTRVNLLNHWQDQWNSCETIYTTRTCANRNFHVKCAMLIAVFFSADIKTQAKFQNQLRAGIVSGLTWPFESKVQTAAIGIKTFDEKTAVQIQAATK
jgi:hypothetical protein